MWFQSQGKVRESSNPVLILILQKHVNNNYVLLFIHAFKSKLHCLHKYKYILNLKKIRQLTNFKFMLVGGVTDINNIAKTQRQSLMG